MTPTLLALHLAAPPELSTLPVPQPLHRRIAQARGGLAQARGGLAKAPLTPPQQSQRFAIDLNPTPWSHGPDGPDDVPEDGYEFKASKKKGKQRFLWAGVSALAVSGITAASARSQSYVMRDAQSLAALDAAYTKQKNLAYTTYTLLGVGALCLALEIPF